MTAKDSKDLYKESGVDIRQGEVLVDWLQRGGVASEDEGTGRVLSGIGGFAGLFQPNLAPYQEPVFVAATDGVGTKLLLAIDHGELEGIGVDLVAMCVNDLYCVGAKPLFFLDYFATGKLSDAQFKAVLSGIRHGLHQCSAALLGGETAELPGLYATGHFDIAGFVVGIVDKERLLGSMRVQPKDELLALASTGFHSNGYSLLRKLLRSHKTLNTNDVKEKLLAPTKIYHEVPNLLQQFPEKIHAVANITGGGISGNLGRVLPERLAAVIDKQSLPTPLWMDEFLTTANLDFHDVEHVFNLGVGMIAVVAPEAKAAIKEALESLGIKTTAIGTVVESDGGSSQEKVRYV